jgi:2-methylcitrate dehydratase PrpD
MTPRLAAVRAPHERPPAQRLTAALAQRNAAWQFATLPGDVRELARQCLLDWLAVAIAGAREPLTRMLAEEAREQGGHRQASVIGHGFATGCRQAALVNGAASHALDFDDVSPSLGGHPSVVLVPPLLALAATGRDGGAAFMTAFVAGYETMCRVGAAVSPGHQAAGFDPTATLGTFGAAAACARLLGLGADDTATALGIAATEAAGLKSMFGTMCKPLDAGRAGADGMLAAQLAARGFTSRGDAIEAAQGFAATHGPDFDPQAALREPDAGLYLRRNLFRVHAAADGTHAAIEATRRLREQHGFRVDEVRSIVVHASAPCEGVCNIDEPRTGIEARLSLRHVVAMAAAGIDTAALSSFTDELANDPGLAELRRRVRVELHAECADPTQAEVVIRTADGAALRQRHDCGAPAVDLAAQRRRLERKFHSLAGPLLPAGNGDELLALVARLEELPDLSPLAGLLAEAPATTGDR